MEEIGTVELITRLFVAAVLGMLIGAEREYRSKEAGIRTHFLVSLGSALFMIVSGYGWAESGLHYDPTRIAAQIVSGIGFIGAGTILTNKKTVTGLSTAAGLWATAGIGIAIGAGMYTIGFTSTILVIVGFEVLKLLVHSFATISRVIVLESKNKDIISVITDTDYSSTMKLISFNMDENNGSYTITLNVRFRGKKQEKRLLELIRNTPDMYIKKFE